MFVLQKPGADNFQYNSLTDSKKLFYLHDFTAFSFISCTIRMHVNNAISINIDRENDMKKKQQQGSVLTADSFAFSEKRRDIITGWLQSLLMTTKS